MDKRTFLKAVGVASSMAGLSTFTGKAVAKPAHKSQTFVMVHGAWHGGWCWKYVADRLRADGHRVYTPSLTGLAERSHLLSTSITLETHISDIANLFEWEDIRDAVLVAHSYGGWPVSGALEKIPDRVRAIVFVDAFMPENGERVLDLNSAKFQQALKDAIAKGEAGRPVPDAAAFGLLRATDRAWVQAKMTPQPSGVAVDPIRLSGARNRVSSKTYVRASGYPQPHFDRYLAAARADQSWRAFEMRHDECGHDVMIDAPYKLTDILLSA